MAGKLTGLMGKQMSFDQGRMIHFAFLLMVVAGGSVMGLSGNLSIGFLAHPMDKVAHFTGFAIFTLVFGSFCRNYFLAAILAIVAGAGVELVQVFIPGRGFSLIDIAANSLGATLIMVIHLFKEAMAEPARALQSRV